MAVERRTGVFIWPTWIAGLLAGDKHCAWAAWFRAHHRYDKRPDEDENQLARWKAEHAEMVRVRARLLELDGWVVSVEDQNKFHYRGRAATVGGCPDLIVVAEDMARIEDYKTGKEREADFWQVVLYCILAPLATDTADRLDGRTLSGTIVYRDRERAISAEDIQASRPLVITQILRTASAEEPLRTPSAAECRYCDIACCPDRMSEVRPVTPVTVEGDLF